MPGGKNLRFSPGPSLRSYDQSDFPFSRPRARIAVFGVTRQVGYSVPRDPSGRRRVRAGDVTLFAIAGLTLLVARIAVWTLPSAYVLRVTTGREPARRLNGRTRWVVTAPRVIWSVRSAARRIPFSNCLTQALAGRFLLARFGYPSKIRVGVRRDEQAEFQAHAWLEHAGDIVIGGRGGIPYQALPVHDRSNS